MSLLLAVLMLVLTAQPATNVTEFRSADVTVRRDTMRSVARTLDRRADDLVALIGAGLHDTDRQVRFSALAAVMEIMGRINRSPAGRTTETELAVLKRLEPGLLHALNDEDFRIRGGAVKALGFVVDESSGAVRDALLRMQPRETDPSVRAAIVGELWRKFGRAQAVQELVAEALKDLNDAVRIEAALGVARFTPQSALPQLVVELNSGNETTRPAFVQALSAYGAQARLYVPVLEGLLGAEHRPAHRDQIRRAIAAIQEPRR